MSDPAYLDPHTNRTYPMAVPRWCGDDMAPLLVTPLPGLTRGRIDATERSLWRYRAALPFPVTDPISMGEGMTPLIPRTLHGARVLLKCDWMNPTGSFKDRGASVMLSMLRAQGIQHVLEDSSGNGGAAVAGYAAAGGNASDDHDPGVDQPRQDRADAGLWRGDPADPRQPPGHRRRGGAGGRVDLLRQPQLASILSPGHQDTRV